MYVSLVKVLFQTEAYLLGLKKKTIKLSILLILIAKNTFWILSINHFGFVVFNKGVLSSCFHILNVRFFFEFITAFIYTFICISGVL